MVNIQDLRRLLWLCLAAASLAWSATAGLEVWAIGDSVRIDPIRSQAFEENPELFPDGVRGNHKQSNLVWNAGARRISLTGARNETVAFQIVIERAGEKLSDIKLVVGELAGPQGARFLRRKGLAGRSWDVEARP